MDPDLHLQYEQLWEHARHQELQRLTFTNIYAIIVAGVLASVLLTEGSNQIIRILLFIFLTLLSLFGLYLTDAWNKSFSFYRELISGLNEMCRLPDEPNYQRWRFPVWKSFLFFYSLTSGFFSALLCFSFIELVFFVSILVNILISIFIWASVTFFFFHRNIKKSNEFRNEILENIQISLNLPITWLNRRKNI